MFLLELALKFVEDIYMYDNVEYFKDASVMMFEEIRFVVKGEKRAVLGGAAKKVFKKTNEYMQFVTKHFVFGLLAGFT